MALLLPQIMNSYYIVQVEPHTPSILKMNSMVVLKELSIYQKVQDGLYMVEKASILL